jgi:hypothetical protein
MTAMQPLSFCSLDEPELAQRLAEWREVGAAARVGPGAWRDEPGVRERLEALIAAEAKCCPTVRFDLRTQDGVLRLEVSA